MSSSMRGGLASFLARWRFCALSAECLVTDPEPFLLEVERCLWDSCGMVMGAGDVDRGVRVRRDLLRPQAPLSFLCDSDSVSRYIEAGSPLSLMGSR